MYTTKQQKSASIADESKKHGQRIRRFSKPKFEIQIKRFMMNRVMRPLKQFLNELDLNPCTKPAYDLVLKENIKQAFKGSYPALKIDYTKLILSKGKLPNAPAISVCSPLSGKLIFRWTDNSGLRGTLASDLLFVAVFNRACQRWVFKMDQAVRSDSHYSLDTSAFRGKLVQVYAGFISEDSRRLSSSLYLGEVWVL